MCQPWIERTLAEQHLNNATLILYDLTSSYLEGQVPNVLDILEGALQHSGATSAQWSKFSNDANWVAC